MMRDSLTIRTPEGIEFSLPLAGPIQRMLAVIIDLTAGTVAAWVLQNLLAPFLIFTGETRASITILLVIVYTSLAEWLWRGQTAGKKLFGLRVVDARGLRLQPSQVIVRNLMRFIDGLPVLYLVGGIACFFHRHRCRLGDVAAGTAVIRTRRLSAPDLDRILEGKYNSLRESRHLAARLRQKVSPVMAQIGLEALIRRYRLDADARLALFGELAQQFRELVPYPAEVVEQLSDEAYVRNVIGIVYSHSNQRDASPVTVR